MAQFLFFLILLLPVASAQNELPRFSPTLFKYRQCPLDSPEIYFENVYKPGLTALLHEGRAFFGSLLEALTSSLNDVSRYEVEEYWTHVSEDILQGQELRAERIRRLWSIVIGRWEGGKLPWEKRWMHPVVSEILGAIGSEHVHLQVLFKRGVKEICSSIQPQISQLLTRLQADFAGDKDTDQARTTKKLERRIREAEPNFVGSLVVELFVHRVGNDSRQLSFVGQLLEEVAIIIESFRTMGSRYPYFWERISQLLKIQIPSEQEVIHKYFSSHDEIAKTLIRLMDANASEK